MVQQKFISKIVFPNINFEFKLVFVNIIFGTQTIFLDTVAKAVVFYFFEAYSEIVITFWK